MTEDILLKKVGQNIRRYRKQQGMTQEELGAKANICYKYIGEIERGRTNPSLVVIYRIAQAMGKENSEILDVTLNPSEKNLYLNKILTLLRDKKPSTLCDLSNILETLINKEAVLLSECPIASVINDALERKDV